jgi:hypothetical protein
MSKESLWNSESIQTQKTIEKKWTINEQKNSIEKISHSKEYRKLLENADEKLEELGISWWIEEIIRKNSNTQYENLHPWTIKNIAHVIWEIKFSQESELIKLQKKYPNNNNLVEEIFQSHLANKVNIKSELFEKLNKVGIYNIEKWEISIRGYNLKKWQEVEVRLKESDRSERGYAKAIHRNKREDFHTAFLKIRQEEYEKKKKQWESIRHMNSEELNTFIISQAQSLNLFFRKENLLSVPIEKKRSFAHKLLYWNISWKVIEYKPTKPWYNDEDNIIINILGTTQKFKIDDIQNKDYIDIKWEVIDYNWKENSIKNKMRRLKYLYRNLTDRWKVGFQYFNWRQSKWKVKRSMSLLMNWRNNY